MKDYLGRVPDCLEEGKEWGSAHAQERLVFTPPTWPQTFATIGSIKRQEPLTGVDHTVVPRELVMPLRLSIKASLTACIALLLCLSLVVSAGGVLGLQHLKTSATDIDNRWLAASQMLGEMSDRLSEFRLAETYRVIAKDPTLVAAQDARAAEHSRVIEDLEAKYIRLAGSSASAAKLSEFDVAWNTYHDAHMKWVSRDPAGSDEIPARPTGDYDALYHSSDGALDGLIDAAAKAADEQVEDAQRTADRDTVLIGIASAAAVLLAGALLVLVRTRITEPLAAITEAMTRLAGGCREGNVPGLTRADEIGGLAKAFEVFRTNAIELEQAQILASSLARHDALTGLPNRRRFASELDEAVSQAQGGQTPSALFLIDLDRFKPINDIHGHAVGDGVLCEIADRLKLLVEREGSVARLGGDEFVLLMPVPDDADACRNKAVSVAKKVLKSVRDPIEANGIRAELDASIGIALCPGNGLGAEDLLRAADLAMYRAKQDGRGGFRFFEQEMDDEVRARAALEADLRAALAADEVRPFYQPLVGLGGKAICGFEVLARWNHSSQGFIPPDVFIPIAEQAGHTDVLTASLLRQACRDAQMWPQDIRLAINVSPAQFQDHTLATRLMAILSKESFSPSRIEVEVTESALIGDIESAKATLAELHALGMTVALDDFGTGYSSLYHLRELKFDKLKIDRSFVQSMQANDESNKIVDTVLSLADKLGMPAVAEGIEDVETMDTLAARGCRFGQGYYFSKAVPAREATLLLTSNGADQLKVAAA